MTVNHDQIQLSFEGAIIFRDVVACDGRKKVLYSQNNNKQPHTEAFQITRAFLCITILGTAA